MDGLQTALGEETLDAEEDLFDVADALERANRPSLARRAYQQLLYREPGNASAAINLGLLEKYLGNTAAARAAILHAHAVEPHRVVTDSCRLLDGGPTFGYTPCGHALRKEACEVLKGVLRAGGYSASAMHRRILPGKGFSPASPPTGTELLLLRKDDQLRQSLLDGPQPEGLLLSLYAMGIAVEASEAAAALGGEAVLNQLMEHGLLLHPPSSPTLVAAPVQIYPLGIALDGEGPSAQGDLLLATDWDLEGLLPTKWSVMPIGNDSLNLVHLAPRRAHCETVLDVCCGSGIQALAALKTYAKRAVCADVSARAIHFTQFNAQLNGVAERLVACVSDVYSNKFVWEAGPYDAILANPPFVAVPRPNAEGFASENADWALYADGGPDGARVLNRLVAEADNDALLRPNGFLSIVSEFPNLRLAHQWLPRLRGSATGDGERGSGDPGGSPEGCGCTFHFAVVYEPAAHVQSADEYATDRSDERGWPWSDVRAWTASLGEHGVEHMGSGLVFAIRREGREAPSGADCALDGPSRAADLSLLESAAPTVIMIRDALLAGASAAELEAMARGHVYVGKHAARVESGLEVA